MSLNFESITAAFQLEPSLKSSSRTKVTSERTNPLCHQFRKVELKKNGFFIDGQKQILRGGSFQWFKMPPEIWEDRILRFKSAGYNTIDMYVSWKNHEPLEGCFDFEKYNLKRFLDLTKKHDMHVIFRPGPYICNEMDSGGLPGWLIAKSRRDVLNPIDKDGLVNLRTHEKDYLDAVKNYYAKVNELIKPYLHTNGGPIILYSVENEYDWFLMLKELDKYSNKKGAIERPLRQSVDTKTYLETLRNFAREDGIDVPITTCPGTGKIEGLGNSRGIAPMPNMYTGLKNAEYYTSKLIEDMHSDKYEGLYKNMPVGVTETSREANVIRRLLLGGMNSIIQFNNLGYAQDGYQNAILINGFLFDNPRDALENLSKMISLKHPNTAFIRPSLGFYPGKGDYYGSAISPSGVFRDNYYNIRRTNLFIEAFSEHLSKGYKPLRTLDDPTLPGQNRRVIIKNRGTGISDPDYPNTKANYWLPLGRDSALIGIHNNSSEPRNLGRNCIIAFENAYPKYSALTVPVEHGLPLSASKNKPDLDYTMLLPYNFPLSKDVTLEYSTSELLTLKDTKEEKILILYGNKGSEGECKFTGKNLKITGLTRGIKICEQNENDFTFSYKHAHPKSLSFTDQNGCKNKIFILDTHLAGKTWFASTKEGDAMFCGVDYVNTLGNTTTLECSAKNDDDTFLVYSKRAISIPDAVLVKPFDRSSGISLFQINRSLPGNFPEIDISSGRTIKDNDEKEPLHDTSGWISLGDKPEHLEKNGIYQGHSWYRAEFKLAKKELNGKSGLFVESAGDFEGIYINGHYINTITPIGTEINNKSLDRGYRFKIPVEVLKEGTNTIAFKTEIWGHGGIHLPQGTVGKVNLFGYPVRIPGIRLKIPYLSYDSHKGISGEAKFNDRPLTNWKLRQGLGGQHKEYHKPNFRDEKWSPANVPLVLEKGAVLWYRTEFQVTDEIRTGKWFAPLALSLKGKNSKASIYLNGKLIGRWLSDNEWLKRGGWFQPIRDMWTSSTTDEFPLPLETLKKGKNVLSIAFEDASGSALTDPPGKIEALKIKLAAESPVLKNDKIVHVSDIYTKVQVN